MRNDAERWGIEVTRVEIFNLDPARDVKEAMENKSKLKESAVPWFYRQTVLAKPNNSLTRNAAKVIFDAVGKAKQL